MLGKFIGLEAYDVAESWRRLREGKDIKKHDLTLLWHEAYEYDLMKLEWNSGPHMDDFSSACDNTHHNKRNRLENGGFAWRRTRRDARRSIANSPSD